MTVVPPTVTLVLLDVTVVLPAVTVVLLAVTDGATPTRSFLLTT
jgi:hypothetical protein